MFGRDGWNPFKTRSLWEGVDYAALVPEPRLESLHDAETGRIVVLVPRYRDWLFGRVLQPRLRPEKRFLRVPLEERGSFLWAQLDAQRSVASLSVSFAQEFPGDAAEAPHRVAVYLHAMYDNGFIRYLNLDSLRIASKEIS